MVIRCGMPAILAATEPPPDDQPNSGAEGPRPPRIVVSTLTISLQEQLIGKDLPLLSAVIPREFSAVLVKVGDTVTLADKTFNTIPVKDALENPRLEMPEFLHFTGSDKKGVELVAEPQPAHIPFEFELSYIAEIYSGI